MFAFNSQGDTLSLTKLFALSTLINVILDPVLIFGWFGIPAFGIAGAAIATVISQAIFIVVAIRALSSDKRRIRFHFSNLTFKWESVKKVLHIGIPASLTQIIMPLGLAAITFITARAFLEPGAIAFSLGFRVEFFAFLPAVGFGFGAMAMMGQNIGAGNIERAKQSFSKAILYGFTAGTGLGILVALFAGAIINVFTSDPLVTEYTLFYMWTVALTYGFLAATMVEANAFQSIDRSWPGFWIFFIRFFVISIPLAYILTQFYQFPILAIWIAIMLGNIISAVIGYVWISRTLKNMNSG